jgi:hypothetical protein
LEEFLKIAYQIFIASISIKKDVIATKEAILTFLQTANQGRMTAKIGQIASCVAMTFYWV